MCTGYRLRNELLANHFDSPETMGAIPAVVYILLIIIFIPFPFYKDIVVATSGGGNREQEMIVPEVHIETGRLLHRFPHNKVIQLLFHGAPWLLIRFIFTKSLLHTCRVYYLCSP